MTMVNWKGQKNRFEIYIYICIIYIYISKPPPWNPIKTHIPLNKWPGSRAEKMTRRSPPFSVDHFVTIPRPGDLAVLVKQKASIVTPNGGGFSKGSVRPKMCQMVSIHHPLEFDWHPLEGAGRWWRFSNMFGMFTPKIGEDEQPIFDEHIFQMGWNHQRDLNSGLGIHSNLSRSSCVLCFPGGLGWSHEGDMWMFWVIQKKSWVFCCCQLNRKLAEKTKQYVEDKHDERLRSLKFYWNIEYDLRKVWRPKPPNGHPKRIQKVLHQNSGLETILIWPDILQGSLFWFAGRIFLQDPGAEKSPAIVLLPLCRTWKLWKVPCFVGA